MYVVYRYGWCWCTQVVELSAGWAHQASGIFKYFISEMQWICYHTTAQEGMARDGGVE